MHVPAAPLRHAVLHLAHGQGTAQQDAGGNSRPRQHRHHAQAHPQARCLPEHRRGGILQQCGRGATGDAAQRNLRIHVFPQGNHRQAARLPSAQDLLLLFIHLAHGWRTALQRPQDHSDARFGWCRLCHDAGKGIHTEADNGVPAAHRRRPPRREEPVDQL